MIKRSWGWRVAAIVAGVALAVGLTACGGSSSSGSSSTSGGGGTTLTLDYVTTPLHPYGIAVNAYAKEVNATGLLTIKTQGSYPQAETQLLDDVRSGVVDMATISSAIWDTAGINAFQALQAPFLITNYTLAGAVEGGDIGKAMIADANEEAGDLVVLAIHEGGLRKPFGEKPLVTAADFDGKTIRAPQSKVLAEGLKALGPANVDPLPLPDVYLALQNGTIDGVEANLPLIYTQKWYEVAKYVTGNVNLWPFPTVLVINKAKYDSLTPEQQTALTDAAANITETSIKIFTTPGSTVAQDLVNCGIVYKYATKADIAGIAKAGAATAEQPGPREPGLRHADPGAQGLARTPPAPLPLPTAETGACKPPAG